MQISPGKATTAGLHLSTLPRWVCSPQVSCVGLQLWPDVFALQSCRVARGAWGCAGSGCRDWGCQRVLGVSTGPGVCQQVLGVSVGPGGSSRSWGCQQVLKMSAGPGQVPAGPGGSSGSWRCQQALRVSQGRGFCPQWDHRTLSHHSCPGHYWSPELIFRLISTSLCLISVCLIWFCTPF